MKKSINKYITIFLCITFFILFFGGAKVNIKNAEDLDIYLGVAASLKKISKNNVEYIATTISSKYKEDGSVESEIKKGEAITIGETREARQRKIGKQFFLGLLQVYIIDKPYAEFGIEDFLNILFKNSVVNDNAFLIVCKENSEKYFQFKIKGYENSSEYIEEMLKNAVFFNFFSDEYTLKDAMLSMDSEGKNFVCPYIKMGGEKIETQGMAIFKKYKLVTVLNMEETKIMNMLRENKGKGVLAIQNNPGKFINYGANVRRRVNCTKIEDKYRFVIDLKFIGDVLNNNIYKSIIENPQLVKVIEGDISKQVEKMCYEFINKMQKEYRVDCLQLGWVAAGKYGRDTGVDWNEIVCNSDIKVNVKVNIDKVGRGKF